MRKVLGKGEEPVLYFITGCIPDKGDCDFTNSRQNVS